MTDDTRNPTDGGNIAGSDYEVGYKKPPKDTRFGGPRAPRRGTKPKSFDALRKLMQTKAGEIAMEVDKDGNTRPIMRDGKPITNAEMFVEAWMKDRKQRKSFAEFAWGKPKEEIDVTTNGKDIEPKVDDERFNRAISTLADAVRESISGTGTKRDSSMDASE